VLRETDVVPQCGCSCASAQSAVEGGVGQHGSRGRDCLDRPVLCTAAGYFFSAATVIAVATRSAPFIS
jgi:hypothetical protein